MAQPLTDPTRIAASAADFTARRQPDPLTPKSWLGHRAREMRLHLERLRKPAALKRAVFFPNTAESCGSANLRAYELATALEPCGWRTTVVPAQLERSQRQRILDLEKPDIAVMQKGRNPLNWPDYYTTTAKWVFDLDDADYKTPEQAVQCEVNCKLAHMVTAGSQNVATWCRQFSKNVHVVWTGHPMPAARPTVRPSKRNAIVAWAQSDSMKYRDEAAIVQRAMIDAADAAKPTTFTFRLYGVRPETRDEANAYLQPLRDAGLTCETREFMPNNDFVASLNEVAIGLHVLAPTSDFAEGKSFGKVLAYLAADVPIIASDLHENPHFFKHRVNGMLVKSHEQYVEAVRELVRDGNLRDTIADAGHASFRDELSIEAIAKRTDHLFRSLLAAPTRNES
jgi:hypothetical protein